ncbi:NUDIX hydrolase [Trueperella pyogenes]
MNNHWLEWATEIQAIAQAGLTYGSDVFDRERYTRLREIAAQIIAEHTDLPIEKVADLFCNEEGYQTPKLDTRAVITSDQAILLVRENDGRWAMPGGWADVGLTPSQNVEKETREEAGLDVVATRVLAVHNHATHNHPRLPWSIWKIFVACEVRGGRFVDNVETTASGYFTPDNLPPLAEGKTTREQIELCLALAADPTRPVDFD